MRDNTDIAVKPVEAVIARVKKVYRSWGRDTTVAQMREDWDALFGVDTVPALVAPVVAGGVPGQWVAAPGANPGKVLLYFHGGGFQVGSSRSHLELMACISAAAGCRVLGLDYRLAPEHLFPAALGDSCAAFDWLLSQGLEASDIALGGDSAGGGLALSTVLARRNTGQPLPAAVVLMSAWTDLTAMGQSYETRRAVDPIHQRPMILAMARNYLGAHGDPCDPLASPLLADLHDLPPLLIQVGDRETVLSDSTLFADKARATGVQVELEVWKDMVHVFQQFPRELEEAREALQSIGRFLRLHLQTDAPVFPPITKGP
ncbi:alpha/beta hydrolase [Xylophilus sp. GW821-FHT01B05]